MAPPRKRLIRRLLWILIAVLVILFLCGAGLTVHWNTGNLASHAQPVNSYAEAMQRIAALQQQENSAYNPLCRTKALTHGAKVQRAIVLVHGYTNCPEQFAALSQALYDQGYNVLVAPLPHHGLADRMNTEIEQLTAEDMTAYADYMIDTAHGLGDQVSMAGISAGGMLAAWAAAHRPDLAQAVVMAPVFGVSAIPTALAAPAANLFQLIPNWYQWWDAQDQGKSPPYHAYPRYSSRALGQLLRLGLAALDDAQRAAPQAGSVIVISNAADQSVDNNLVAAYIAALGRNGAANLRTYEFPAALGLDHDFIDPQQKKQHIDVVYPKLLELIAQQQ